MLRRSSLWLLVDPGRRGKMAGKLEGDPKFELGQLGPELDVGLGLVLEEVEAARQSKHPLEISSSS